MTDREDDNDQGKIVFDDNNPERKSCSCLGQKCSRASIVFLSQLFVICSLLLAAFGDFIPGKFVANQLFGWSFCVVHLGTFYYHQDYERVNLDKKSRFYIIGRSVWD